MNIKITLAFSYEPYQGKRFEYMVPLKKIQKIYNNSQDLPIEIDYFVLVYLSNKDKQLLPIVNGDAYKMNGGQLRPNSPKVFYNDKTWHKLSECDLFFKQLFRDVKIQSLGIKNLY